MKKILLLNGLIVFALLVCSGCASIVDGRPKKINLNSNPSGARVTVTDSKGQSIVDTKTPAVVRLTRGKGYFQGEQYTVKFKLDGYYPSEAEILPKLNGWYFGNILFGGVIGIAAVDPLTGAMWTLAPRNINRNLISTSQNLTPEQLKAAEETANPPPKRSSTSPSQGKSK